MRTINRTRKPVLHKAPWMTVLILAGLGIALTGCAPQQPVNRPCGVIVDSLLSVNATSRDGTRRLADHYARGKAVVVLDADLQDPPEVILEMVAKWREGFDVVLQRTAAGAALPGKSLVVMDPEEAGWESTRFSATRAAAVTCAIMSPDSSPGWLARNGGNSSLRAGLTNRSMRRSEMPARAVSATAR